MAESKGMPQINICNKYGVSTALGLETPRELAAEKGTTNKSLHRIACPS